MRAWWQRRSLRLRLAVWFAAVSGIILLGLAPVVYWLIQHRLQVDLDNQLRIDWNLIEAHLEADESGAVRWKRQSPATPESPGYASTWFDVWMGNQVVLRHWPLHGSLVSQPPRLGAAETSLSHTLMLTRGQPARALEQPAQLDGRHIVLRVFRDQTGLQQTLRQILASFGLGVPLAAALAALGGYAMAGRALRPIGAMAQQARQITSESLSQRLPNPNPHDELGQLASVFNATLERLQNSFEALKTFTADASHELRTPLTALRTVGEVALRGSSDPKALRETVASMLEEAQRLHDLIDSMLLLARVEGGRTVLQSQTIELAPFIEETCETLEVLATEKQQTLTLDLTSNLSAVGDRVLLRHGLVNILNNAILYSPEGSRVLVRSFRHNQHAVIEVADEGPGIAPEYNQKIFERFFRIDKARSRDAGGAGLGLAIAKSSIQRMGGSIELTSELGQGSRFRIVLQPA